jgi:MFS family permease
MSRDEPRAHEWRRGWPVLVGSAAMAGTGSGLYQNLSSLFMPGLERVMGATRGEISTSAAFGLLGALAAPYIGRLADRIGVVPVIVVSALGIGAAHLWFSTMNGPFWQFQVGIALLALCAPGVSALIYGRLVAKRFDRHRGLALGLATSGLSLFTVLLPGLAGWIIATWGWQAGYYLLAALAVGVGLPAGLLAARSAGTLHRPVRDHAPIKPSWRDRLFWRLASATMLINIGTVGMVTQLALIGQERGIGLATSGLLLSAYGASQIGGRLVMGVLIDRFAANRIAAAFGLASAVGFIALVSGQGGLAFVLVAVFVAGLLNGAEYDLTPYLVTRLFPLEVYGELFGRLTLFSILSGGMGLASFGLLHDWTGNYAAPLAIGAIAMLLATVLLYGVPAYDPRAGRGDVSPSTSR